MPEQTRRFIFVSEAIVFTSGKGGVGKTTVISNIGVELSQLDKKVIMLDTDMGLLTVRGKALHVSRLTLEKGEVDIEGEFESFSYSSNESRRKSQESFFGRLFR